jgi:carbohydrate diacid regulator
VIELNNELVQIAQTMVKALSNAFPFSISLSDAEGYIVGSTDPERIGTFHPVSKEVIKRNNFIAYRETEVLKFDNVLPGVAVPLHFQQRTVGVLGIIGAPEAVKHHAELAKQYVELMWQETYYKQLNNLEEKIEEAYLQYILLNESKESARIADYCRALHLDRNSNTFCIVIDLREYLIKEYTNQRFSPTMSNLKKLLFSEVKQQFPIRHIMKMGFLNAEKIVLLMAVSSHEEYALIMKQFQQTCRKLLKRLKDQHISNLIIAAGKLTPSVLSIAESFREAEHLIRQAKETKEKKQILSYYDWDILTNILPFKIDQSFKAKIQFHLERILKDQKCNEMIQTFNAYCESGMNITEAAKSLYVHRNTVIYRLKKLEEVILIDTKDFQQCSLLYLTVKDPSL